MPGRCCGLFHCGLFHCCGACPFLRQPRRRLAASLHTCSSRMRRARAHLAQRSPAHGLGTQGQLRCIFAPRTLLQRALPDRCSRNMRAQRRSLRNLCMLFRLMLCSLVLLAPTLLGLGLIMQLRCCAATAGRVIGALARASSAVASSAVGVLSSPSAWCSAGSFAFGEEEAHHAAQLSLLLSGELVVLELGALVLERLSEASAPWCICYLLSF